MTLHVHRAVCGQFVIFTDTFFLSRGHRRRRQEQQPEREGLGGRHAARTEQEGARKESPAGGRAGARRGVRERGEDRCWMLRAPGHDVNWPTDCAL